MNTRTALAGLLLALSITPAAALAADPKVDCTNSDGMHICTSSDGTYQITSPQAMIAGRCGGQVSWEGMTFPQASAVHQVVCGPDAHLELR